MMDYSTVTIDKTYFHNLLRRAHFHSTGHEFLASVDVPTVNIPKADHENLLQIAKDYNQLRRGLRDGGVKEEVLNTLIRSLDEIAASPQLIESPEIVQTLSNETIESNFSPNANDTRLSISRSTPPKPIGFLKAIGTGKSSSRGNTFAPIRNFKSRQRRTESDVSDYRHQSQDRRPSSGSESSEEAQVGEFDEESIGSLAFPYFATNYDDRTLILSNIAPSTTLNDIVQQVRGGKLLDIYLVKDREAKAANISFVDGSAAHSFFAYVKRNDLYIGGRRVEISWSSRHAILYGYIAKAVQFGSASRNLQINSLAPDISTEKIERDLEHIHHLAVVNLSISSNTAYISLNSIRSAMYAKQCLSSRIEYRNGAKIIFMSDECSQELLEKSAQARRPALQSKKPNIAGNMFEVLASDFDGFKASDSGCENLIQENV